MFWRWLLVFGLNCLGVAIILVLLFRYLKVVPQKDSASLVCYLLVWSPLILLANYFFFSAYNFGLQFKEIFGDKRWIINVSNYLGGILVFLILAWFFYQELPSKGVWAALALSGIGIAISIFLK